MTTLSSRTLLVALAGAAMALGVGCDSASSGSGSASAGGSGAPAAKSGAATTGSGKASAAAATPEAPKVELVDHDLSSADAKWAGWTVKGPADAKVMQDGVAGARLAGKGPSIMERKPGGDEGFDIAFAWGKEDLKKHIELVKKGGESAKSTVTVTKDEAGLLEYTIKSEAGNTTYNFLLHMNVEKADITCKNGSMMGAGNEAEHKRLIEACKSLAKKAK